MRKSRHYRIGCWDAVRMHQLAQYSDVTKSKKNYILPSPWE
jgi:hypothetical protein